MVNTPDLPPIPDPVTGEPRPPRAPRILGGQPNTPSDQLPHSIPAPPPIEFGAALEVAQPRFGDRFGASIAIPVLFALYGTVIWGGFGWVQHWFNWALIVSFSLLVRRGNDRWTAAGATWLQKHTRSVDTYQLTKVHLRVSRADRQLFLRDAHGRKIDHMRIAQIQANPALWDLVYNGILHSVASGNCDIDSDTRKHLRIPFEIGPRPKRFAPRKGRATLDPLRRTTGRPANLIPRTGRHRAPDTE
ncbi:hypothetical protein [Rhodococcus sp. SJ-2]